MNRIPSAAGQVGIVACSPPGAALCYQAAASTIDALTGPRPEISLHGHPFAIYMRHVNLADWPGVADLMLSSAQYLTDGGATVLIAPCNTIHAAWDHLMGAATAPWIHIADSVAEAARLGGYRRLGLLGSRVIMEGPIYADRLKNWDIEIVTPAQDDRDRIDALIFDDLVSNRVPAGAAAYLSEVIDRLREQGCDAIGLCCTELPMAVSQNTSSLPLIDSTECLARAAVSRALESSFLR